MAEGGKGKKKVGNSIRGFHQGTGAWLILVSRYQHGRGKTGKNGGTSAHEFS